MPVHRSAMGKQVDMTALQKKNEKIRAVGNMSVNARGDTIDSHGRIIKPVTEKVNAQYSKTVGNKSAQVKPQQSNPSVKTQPKLEVDEILNDLEKDLESNIEEELEIEQMKAKEQEKNARN